MTKDQAEELARLSSHEGGPFFPVTFRGEGEKVIIGATLRDHFAAEAMHALILNNETDGIEVCRTAFEYADEMLVARKRSGG